jgi:hypothetical protein
MRRVLVFAVLILLTSQAFAATQTRFPTSDNSSSGGGWTVIGTTLAYAAVSDTSDTTYIAASAIGRYLFNFSPFSIPDRSTISRLTIYYKARRASAGGAGTIRSALLVGGTNYDATEAGQNLTNAFTDYNSYTHSSVYIVNPKTSVAWTTAEVIGSGQVLLKPLGLMPVPLPEILG